MREPEPLRQQQGGVIRAAGRGVRAHEVPHHRRGQPALPGAAHAEGAGPHAHGSQRAVQVALQRQAVRSRGGDARSRAQVDSQGAHPGVERQGQVRRRDQLPGVEDEARPRAAGVWPERRGGPGAYHEREEGVEPAAHQPGVPGADVHGERAAGALPQGVGEEQLRHGKVGEVHMQERGLRGALRGGPRAGATGLDRMAPAEKPLARGGRARRQDESTCNLLCESQQS
mmetsp:Transcript_6014/g.20531  ORF Transcript_6014/g.20531 Transcript_6014/m.20531 type:complete len:228 (+) Transcript_6014:2025-2708(+)